MKPLDYFKKLNEVPRPSFHEEKAIEYLENFAKELNLDYAKDKKGNIVIYKPGRTEEPIILQGHVDMVCVKEEGVEHDFFKDPIQTYVKDGWMYAKGTTLGADNGAAVAMIQAILASDDDNLPSIEALFTVEEEVGLTGAKGVEKELLKGKTLINIDSEEEGIFTLACAGGLTQQLTKSGKREKVSQKGIEVIIRGLEGGHSGMLIHLQRANAIKIFSRLFNDDDSLRIDYIKAGSADNAICEYLKATILTSLSENEIKSRFERIKKEHVATDKFMEIELTGVEIESVFDLKTSQDFVRAIFVLPCGVLRYSDFMEDLVETSVNMGQIDTTDDSLELTCSHRSSVESQKFYSTDRFKEIARVYGLSESNSGGYPSWPYKEESEIRDIFISAYRDLFNVEPKTMSIHAGLECGVFREKLGDIDMISFGPEMEHVHSPKERLNLESFERNYELLKEVLHRWK